jgi:adenylate cyclase
MHDDEEASHTRLTALLTGSVSPAITEHGGRIVKNTGDGFLAEFPSTVEAVRAAVQFQARIAKLTLNEVEEEAHCLPRRRQHWRRNRRASRDLWRRR